jgi:uncharacterized protein YjcR
MSRQKKTNRTYTRELKEAARLLFMRGFTVAEIATELSIQNPVTVYEWKRKDAWDARCNVVNDLEINLARRICCLTERDNKTADEVKELEVLLKRLEALAIPLAKARLIDRSQPGEVLFESRGRPVKEKAGSNGSYVKQPRNVIDEITKEQLDEFRERKFFSYQKLWWAAKNNEQFRRNRFILKSRQIGATYYFAWEALEDAILTGDNQIFLSASRDQAEVFKAYMILFGKELGVELAGNPMILSNGAEIRFLSTNARTAQSYHGHLYVDEVFWIPFFSRLWKVASGMAAHKKWRRTLFSTPSAMSHEAYAMWCGEIFNKKKDKKITFDLSRKTLKAGLLGQDNIWRQSVTIIDAEEAGCDLFNIEELRTEYSEDDFDNLFMCQFIDDARSVFSLALLLACGVEPETWKDYRASNARPFNNRPVAIGYDPSRTSDNASVVVMAVPLRPGDKWRLLKRLTFNHQSFAYQAARIRELCECFHVVHVGIDVSGMGYGVFELVVGFYPAAQPITYSLQMKNQLVIKALDVIQAPSRLEFDLGDKDLIASFLLIRKTTSDSGQITYVTSRTGEQGHADAAWAVMHALIYEPLNTQIGGTTVAFS